MTDSLYNSIFLVDDDEDDREIFVDALKEVNPAINVLTAKDGQDALNKLESYQPDIIFLDLNMPGMDGMQFLARYKKDTKYPQAPVIILTTSSHSRDKDITHALGASHFITKCDTFDKVVATIRNTITIDWKNVQA